MYLCMYVCMYVCIYVCTYGWTDVCTQSVCSVCAAAPLPLPDKCAAAPPRPSTAQRHTEQTLCMYVCVCMHVCMYVWYERLCFSKMIDDRFWFWLSFCLSVLTCITKSVVLSVCTNLDNQVLTTLPEGNSELLLPFGTPMVISLIETLLAFFSFRSSRDAKRSCANRFRSSILSTRR